MSTQPLTRFCMALLVIFSLGGISHLNQANATESQTLSSGWLLETARNVYLTSDPWIDSDCVVDIINYPSDLIVYRSGNIDVSGILERTPNSIKDIGAVTVEVFINGELYMRFDPTPYLNVTVSAFTAADDIDREVIITDADVVVEQVDVRTLPVDDPCTSLDEILGQTVRMNIQGGRIFTYGILTPPTLVERGDAVLVNVPIGSIFITLHGIALDDGAIDDEIRVRNPDSDVIITAVVTGPSTAQLYLIN